MMTTAPAFCQDIIADIHKSNNSLTNFEVDAALHRTAAEILADVFGKAFRNQANGHPGLLIAVALRSGQLGVASADAELVMTAIDVPSDGMARIRTLAEEIFADFPHDAVQISYDPNLNFLMIGRTIFESEARLIRAMRDGHAIDVAIAIADGLLADAA